MIATYFGLLLEVEGIDFLKLSFLFIIRHDGFNMSDRVDFDLRVERRRWPYLLVRQLGSRRCLTGGEHHSAQGGWASPRAS
jgi:hypothetical protein